MKVVCGVRKDGEMGLAPARNDRASRSLVPETCYAETQLWVPELCCRSRQEGEGELSCPRPLEEEGVVLWQEEEARPSHEADSPTPAHWCIICSSEDGRHPHHADFCTGWS